MARPGLLESLEELRAIAPQLDLALEIHESVLTRPAAIAELRALLLERNIALAYDDFGAGQARLLELAEAPPHYLKFDRRFVHGLDQAPAGEAPAAPVAPRPRAGAAREDGGGGHRDRGRGPRLRGARLHPRARASTSAARSRSTRSDRSGLQGGAAPHPPGPRSLAGVNRRSRVRRARRRPTGPRSHRLEAHAAFARHELGEERQVGGDDGRDLRVAAGRRTVRGHDDRPAVGRHLDRARHHAVGEDLGRAGGGAAAALEAAARRGRRSRPRARRSPRKRATSPRRSGPPAARARRARSPSPRAAPGATRRARRPPRRLDDREAVAGGERAAREAAEGRAAGRSRASRGRRARRSRPRTRRTRGSPSAAPVKRRTLPGRARTRAPRGDRPRAEVGPLEDRAEVGPGDREAHRRQEGERPGPSTVHSSAAASGGLPTARLAAAWARASSGPAPLTPRRRCRRGRVLHGREQARLEHLDDAGGAGGGRDRRRGLGGGSSAHRRRSARGRRAR